jgi:cytochrome c553
MFVWSFPVLWRSRCAIGLAIWLLLACATARAADVPHPMAERTAACTACHGTQGKAGPDGYYPRLAGKPAGYLYNQLRNFQDARRHYTLMAGLLAPLGPDYLRDMATYFSELDVPYPAPARSSAPAAVLARGKTLVLQGDKTLGIPACVACHGQALTGVAPNTPGLLGLPRDYLNAQLGGWQTGQRKAHAPDCMAAIARKLSADDVNAATQWLSSQTLPAITKPVAQRPAALPGALALPPCGSVP